MKKGKRIVIRPFQKEVKPEPDFAQDSWKLLKNAIIEIWRQNTGQLSYEELYRTHYNMCLNKHGEYLYNGVKETLRDLFKEVGTALTTHVDEDFLTKLNTKWQSAKVHLAHLRDILMYMDRTYVHQNSLTPVYDLGLTLFREVCLDHESNAARVTRLILHEIHRERIGETVDRAILKSLTQMLIDLGVHTRDVYERVLEVPFLEASTQFYHAEASDFIASNPCPIYLAKVDQRLQEEVTRTEQYLHEGTTMRVLSVVEKVMIKDHVTVLVEMEQSGAVALLRDDKLDDLRRMYSLFARVENGLQPLQDAMQEFVKKLGAAVATNAENVKDPMGYVNEMLSIKDKFDAIVKDSFNNDRQFVNAQNKAFEHFMNLGSKSPEYLSLFVDEKLRKGLKGVSEDEVEAILDKAVMLFRFIQEKDVFERYYKQHLSKRLLYNRSVSDEAESRMLSKLKTECGFQFTSKLEGMFTDMKVSADTMDTFKSFLAQSAQKLPLDISVHVLTQGSWPIHWGGLSSAQEGEISFACKLPAEILRCTTVFEKFYLQQHSGRRLGWHTTHGTADLKTTYCARTYQMNVSTHAMVVLLLFNETDGQLSYKDIAEATKIDDKHDKELTRTLQSLSCAKYKILTKEPATRKVSPTDLFSVNKAFTNKMMKFKISTVILKETDSQRAETMSKVDEDRKHSIEACIVRIMKARKTNTHEKLVTEVIEQLSSRFRPVPQVVKSRIESLIDREYLIRDEQDRRVYHYSA